MSSMSRTQKMTVAPGLSRLHSSKQPRISGASMRQAWRTAGENAITVPGLAVMASSAAMGLVWRLPALATLLAPRCLTPWSRVGLAMVTTGAPMLLYPIFHLVDEYAKNTFCTTFMISRQQAMSRDFSGQASLWKRENIATNCKQLLLTRNNNLARDVASSLSHAVRIGVDICLSLGTFASLQAASPAIVAVALGVSIFPSIASFMANRARTGIDARVIAAELKLQQHIDGFWDNTVIGPASCRDLWQKNYRTKLQNVRRARFVQSMVNQACQFFSNIPQNVMNTLIQLPSQMEMLFEDTYHFASTEQLRSYNSVSMSLGALSGAFDLFNSIQSMARKIEIQRNLNAQRFEGPSLESMIKPEQLLMTRHGNAIDVADVIKNPQRVGGHGLITLRAPNGTGKTALMSHLRQHYGDDALFLPAAHTLSFGLPKGSTGQTVMQILDHVDHLEPKPPFIFLDEWDANLDEKNTRKARAMIDRWSKERCVIEVRNRE